jgi:hypothetical protein
VLRPYKHHNYEIVAMRVLFAVVVFLSVKHMLPPLWGEGAKAHALAAYPEAKNPTGIAHLIPLGWMSGVAAARVVMWFMVAGLIAYATVPIRFLKYPTLVVFLIHNAVFTLNNSQGSTHHGYQIVTLTLLAQVAVLWMPTVCRWLKKKSLVPEGLQIGDLWVYYSQLAIAAAYVIAAVSKLLRSGIGWIIDSPLIAVQVVKTHSQNYYNYLQADFADMGMTYATWVAAHPGLTRIMLTGGLLLELFAFLALIGRRWAFAIGAAMVGLHVSISMVMHLHFPQNEQTCLIFLVNIPFWAALAGKKLRAI